MFFIYSIILINFVKYTFLFGPVPLKTDYYESLSDPVMCVELSHHYPTGPPFFHSKFIYNRFPKNSDHEIQNKSTKYVFKKLDKQCTVSTNLTLGIDFKELEIEIRIYLSEYIGNFARFVYKFSIGIKPGVYQLTDINNNFIIAVKVINEPQDYLGVPTSDKYPPYFNDNYIKTKNDRLCLITENNKAVILNPKYINYAPDGFIYGIMAEIFREKEFIAVRSYNAYVCQKDEKYPKIPTVFIIDGDKYNVKFSVLYRENIKRARVITMKFELSRPKFIKVNKLKYINKSFNKVFLIRLLIEHIDCPDKSIIYLYRSNDNTAYYVHAEKTWKILSAVEFIGKIDRSVDDPCGVLKK